jgi:hypothetical protein
MGAAAGGAEFCATAGAATTPNSAAAIVTAKIRLLTNLLLALAKADGQWHEHRRQRWRGEFQRNRCTRKTRLAIAASSSSACARAHSGPWRPLRASAHLGHERAPASALGYSSARPICPHDPHRPPQPLTRPSPRPCRWAAWPTRTRSTRRASATSG